MKKAKKKRLEAAGWTVGSARDFLSLTSAESVLIEIKMALAESLRKLRRERGLTQAELARLLASSQPRVANMEAGEASVSLDLLVRALLVCGATQKEVGRIIGRRVA